MKNRITFNTTKFLNFLKAKYKNLVDGDAKATAVYNAKLAERGLSGNSDSKDIKLK